MSPGKITSVVVLILIAIYFALQDRPRGLSEPEVGISSTEAGSIKEGNSSGPDPVLKRFAESMETDPRIMKVAAEPMEEKNGLSLDQALDRLLSPETAPSEAAQSRELLWKNPEESLDLIFRSYEKSAMESSTETRTEYLRLASDLCYQSRTQKCAEFFMKRAQESSSFPEVQVQALWGLSRSSSLSKTEKIGILEALRRSQTDPEVLREFSQIQEFIEKQ